MATSGSAQPRDVLARKAAALNFEIADPLLARVLDKEDPVRHLRDQFYYPHMKDLPHVDLTLVDDPEGECVYFCGNSLGLQPKGVPALIDRELRKWAQMGVYGHKQGEMPWALCDECVDEQMADLVGARRDEVAVMNGTTVNIHVLLATFYEPTPQRHKILIQDKAFPSDHYAVESQIRLKGYNPETSLLIIRPREGECCLRPEDILDTIEKEGESIAVIWLEGVHYFTGQLLDMPSITRAGHDKGCLVAFDLAHAAGNVPLSLHDWNVDFAVWCTYKYLCSGAGGIACAFIHQSRAGTYLPKFTGWWGHDKATRFEMTNKMDLAVGAQRFRLSNPAALLCVPLKACLDVYSMTDMNTLREKSKLLTGYLEMLIQLRLAKSPARKTYVEICTPSDVEQRGCQLSLRFSIPIHSIFTQLTKRGIVCDERLPDVIRISPVHLYCSFEDVYRFVSITAAILKDLEDGSKSTNEDRVIST